MDNNVKVNRFILRSFFYVLSVPADKIEIEMETECLSLFAGSRRHGRGWHRTLGRGNSVRGYYRSRLLPLQHETTDGSLATANQLRGWSTVGKRKKGSNSVSSETIVAAAKRETLFRSVAARETSRQLTTTRAPRLFALLIFFPVPSATLGRERK